MNIQTPYYLIHKDRLDILISELESALNKYWINHITGYSIKTNSLPWIVRYMMEKGFYAEAVSGDEYRLAKKTGFGNRIIYNGPVKSKETVLEAVETGCEY